MKKITIENFNGQTVIMARKIISMTDTILTYEPKHETRGAIAIDNNVKVIIEDYEEKRDWFVVCVKSSGFIYAVNEHQFFAQHHVKLLSQPMTETEAKKLVEQLDRTLDVY
ncbi:hypothetical protein KMD50_gp25 [Lactococcus phage PLgW-1]|uniref:Uncharacterized protein n=3 Tax=Uwajimavirus PLgW1 TaxID=2845441 RepID=A0A2Z2P1V2_9CAUD|nr:hypothetical protein KMD50_gp25 [Lactococcus phage PLgW-1]ARQ94836.1 hypothetical protein PLgW1_25 [Lactococcus phage PLgW-1]ASJ80008.1 hypothetical protein [Lactococcus phage PLgY-16]ASJ80063.1 hypothetical protein [Lactococcus phage PLgY-30]